MDTHVKILGVLFLATALFGLAIALIVGVAIGGAAGIVGTAADPDAAAVAVPILGLAGSVAVALLLIFSLPGLVVGFGLLKFRPWARILGIVWSAVSLIYFPIGTIIGIYGLWVLLTKDTERLFLTPPPAAM